MEKQVLMVWLGNEVNLWTDLIMDISTSFPSSVSQSEHKHHSYVEKCTPVEKTKNKKNNPELFCKGFLLFWCLLRKKKEKKRAVPFLFKLGEEINEH